jgi:hypothetical protein
MYFDFPPQADCPARKVVVIEDGDKPYNLIFTERVIDFARANDATSRDGDGDEIFWIVFDDQPKRAWDMTESALRSELGRPKSELINEADLGAMGSDAPIAEILETFDYGGFGSFARKELPRACIELEVTTIGQLASLTRSEIAGPGSRRLGNKTLSYIDCVLRQLGMEPLRDFAKA